MSLDADPGPPPQFLPLPNSTPDDVLEGLTAAIASDDQEGFSRILVSYAASDRCENVFELQPVFKQAITQDKPFFVRELLRNGLQVLSSHVQFAIDAKAKRSLQVFMGDGYYDINKHIGTNTPGALHYAVQDADMAFWLIDHGADLNQQALTDITPMSFFVILSSPDLIKALLDRGVDVHKGELLQHALDRKTDTTNVLALLLDRGAPLNAVRYNAHEGSRCMFSWVDWGTPLHTAAEAGMVDAVRLLLERGADPAVPTSIQGRTPKELAEASGHTEVVEMLAAAEDKARRPRAEVDSRL